MQTLEQANQRAADPRFAGPFGMYWLAFLLTGHRETSVDVTLEAFQDGANPFFSTWMLHWSRRLVVAKALGSIRAELAASARQTSKRAATMALPPRNWALDEGTTKIQLERALLAIDLFPRGALLLTVFEGMSLEEAAILLDGDRDLVRKARNIGLRELTRNFARMQGWKSAATRSTVVMSEMQHA